MQVILSALCLPDFVISRGLSTIYRQMLTDYGPNIPFHEKSLIRGCCNHKGTLAAHI